MLTIKNVNNIMQYSVKTDVKVVKVTSHNNTYTFQLKHRNFKGDYRYTVIRENGVSLKYVGTFGHPYGSHRQDCYEMDLLDKESFLDFLDTLIVEWYVKHHQ